VNNLIKKYQNGYNQIIKTEGEVGEKQIKLQDLVPKIKETAEKTEKMMIVVAEEKSQADELAAAIREEEAIVQVAVDKANAIKEECESELAVAIPVLEAAQKALQVVTKEALGEIRGFSSPP
jgi:dynein heavy chain, axonemal